MNFNCDAFCLCNNYIQFTISWHSITYAKRENLYQCIKSTAWNGFQLQTHQNKIISLEIRFKLHFVGNFQTIVLDVSTFALVFVFICHSFMFVCFCVCLFVYFLHLSINWQFGSIEFSSLSVTLECVMCSVIFISNPFCLNWCILIIHQMQYSFCFSQWFLCMHFKLTMNRWMLAHAQPKKTRTNKLFMCILIVTIRCTFPTLRLQLQVDVYWLKNETFFF